MSIENNKKIGIIGGVGPQASCYLYTKIIEYSNKFYHAKKNDDYPRIVIDSVPIPDFISDLSSLKIAKEMLEESIERLIELEVSCIAIGSNTVHMLFDELSSNKKTRFLSIIDVVVEEIKARKLKKIGILASPTTLRTKLYDGILDKLNIEIIRPAKIDYNIIENAIRSVIAHKINRKDQMKFRRLLQSLFNEGAESVLLSCTELPLFVNYKSYGNKIINSLDLLAKGLVEYYYN